MITFFNKFPKVVAGLSEKSDGPMRISDTDENTNNRKKFFETHAVDTLKVFSADLVHDSKVEVVTENDALIVKATDALVTKKDGLFLSITIADCTPVLFYDSIAGIVGIAHAGWRGAVKKIAGKTLETFVSEGGKMENILVEFGPHILSCHFEIQDDVVTQFSEYPEAIIRRDGKIFVNLQSIIKKQLEEAGIPESNITTTEICTFCDRSTFFSFRREKPEKVESMVAFIGMK